MNSPNSASQSISTFSCVISLWNFRGKNEIGWCFSMPRCHRRCRWCSVIGAIDLNCLEFACIVRQIVRGLHPFGIETSRPVRRGERRGAKEQARFTKWTLQFLNRIGSLFELFHIEKRWLGDRFIFGVLRHRQSIAKTKWHSKEREAAAPVPKSPNFPTNRVGGITSGLLVTRQLPPSGEQTA